MEEINAVLSDGDGSEPVDVRVRIFQRGRIWHANFQHTGNQHRVSLKTMSKKEARRRALRLESELEAGRWKPSPSTASVDEAIAAYRDFLRAEERARKTLSKYDNVFDRVAKLARQRHIKDLSGLSLRFIDAYRRLRTDEKAQPKTRYTETVIIRQLVNFALTRDMLATDPLKGLKLKKPKPTPQPCWTCEQVEQILAGTPDDIKPALTLLAETGMRFGELQWLTWEDIDLETNLLTIQPKDDWKPKSGDRRALPLSAPAREVVESLPRGHRWVITMPPSARHPRSGRQWTERRLLAALQRVLKKLELPGKLHTFRHYFISNALLKGTAEAMVRAWVGHVDSEIIQLYTHVHNQASQAAMQRLAEANQKLQSREQSSHDAGNDSAQIQHSREEPRIERGAK
jgi:site-specific recombinase XerD